MVRSGGSKIGQNCSYYILGGEKCRVVGVCGGNDFVEMVGNFFA